jgi:hypothetical protein
VPAVASGAVEEQVKVGFRALLSDRKSWETSGGFSRTSVDNPGTGRLTLRPPPAEIFKAWREHCPAIGVTADPANADAIVLIDRQAWRSPTYPVSVFRLNGDVLYAGGARLLGNAVKDACKALTAQR